MKISQVTYSKTFGMPDKKDPFEKILLVGELEEGDTARQALYALRKEAHDFHYESNKAAEKQAEITEEPKSKLSQVEQIIQDISTCREVKVLEVYQLLAKNNPKIQEAYNNKMNEILTREAEKDRIIKQADALLPKKH